MLKIICIKEVNSVTLQKFFKVYTPDTKSYFVKVELNNKITIRHLSVSRELVNDEMFNLREYALRQISKG